MRATGVTLCRRLDRERQHQAQQQRQGPGNEGNAAHLQEAVDEHNQYSLRGVEVTDARRAM
jgi:hypothetical protein